MEDDQAGSEVTRSLPFFLCGVLGLWNDHRDCAYRNDLPVWFLLGKYLFYGVSNDRPLPISRLLIVRERLVTMGVALDSLPFHLNFQMVLSGY